MTKQIFKTSLKTFVIIFFMAAIISCNSNNKTKANSSSTITSEKEVIPDTVVQFLITSVSKDFRNHRQQMPIDFRNIKIGYLKSPDSEKMFILCGEFLSQENKEWIEFTTIKTMGYEQYIGKTQYCQDATMVLTDENLSVELKKNWLNK
jgi:hypothetical protein